LTEFANGLRQGITYSTNIGGKSLIDLINNNSINDSLINNKSDNNTNAIKEEMKSITKRLSSIECSLTQLSQTINSLLVTNSNSYQIITSPSMLSNSSELYVNPIGYNSTPIVLNEQNLLNINQNETQSKTPSKCVYNSPRRKGLPRRRILSGSSPLKPSSDCDMTLVSSQINSSIDGDRDESEPQLKIDITEPLIQPEVIVGELINYEPLHSALAENINRIFNSSNNSEDISDNGIKIVDQNNSQPKDSECVENKCDPNSDTQEIQLSDDVVHDIIANLELAPEYNKLLGIITEKELQMTPYKNILSPFEGSSSASSLNTPKTPQIRFDSPKNGSDRVVKNLMPDLQTPEKSVTLYAARNSSLITPIKVTPLKVLRTNQTPCKTIFVPEFSLFANSSSNHSVVHENNIPIVMPNVSIMSEDNYLYNYSPQNSITNNGSAYTMRVQTNGSQTQFINSNGVSVRNKGKKKVDFSKPASELQVKRPDLNPRKILPKPTNRSTISTTITPVCTETNETIVPKQPIIKHNSHSNLTNNYQNVSQTIDSRVIESDRNKKRSNPGIDETPNKIRVSLGFSCFVNLDEYESNI
jgi:hypothetical protein